MKDIRSGVKINTSSYGTTTEQKRLAFNDAFNVDPTGRQGGIETGDTLLNKANDDERTLIFPLQNQTVANLSPSGSSSTTYRFKRTSVKYIFLLNFSLVKPIK